MFRNLLLLSCLVVMGAAVLWPVVIFLPLNPMPGDMTIVEPTLRLYVPATTCMSASVVLTLLFWYMKR